MQNREEGENNRKCTSPHCPTYFPAVVLEIITVQQPWPGGYRSDYQMHSTRLYLTGPSRGSCGDGDVDHGEKAHGTNNLPTRYGKVFCEHSCSQNSYCSASGGLPIQTLNWHLYLTTPTGEARTMYPTQVNNGGGIST